MRLSLKPAIAALVLFCAPAFAAEPCKATTDIPQFQIHAFQRVCNGPHLRAVSFMGTHASAVYTIADDRDYSGHEIAGTDFSHLLEAAAKDAHARLAKLYMMERFEYRLQDSRDVLICAFRFVGSSLLPVAGWCLADVP